VRLLIDGELDFLQSLNSPEQERSVRKIFPGMICGDRSLTQEILDEYSSQTILSKLCSIYVSPKVSGFDEQIIAKLRQNPEG
jgi:hypothetical protein